MIYLYASAYGSYRPIARLRHCAILPFFLTVGPAPKTIMSLLCCPESLANPVLYPADV